jgi:hypothetical protein
MLTVGGVARRNILGRSSRWAVLEEVIQKAFLLIRTYLCSTEDFVICLINMREEIAWLLPYFGMLEKIAWLLPVMLRIFVADDWSA